ncbi:hypothetical protein AB4Y30_04125 [Ornithinibacillus sp. 4-3]|uniref:Uncharacterized protein n=1 Tax=Ornithinibacillus sp. 4-3 TaxID=3231488 RepID=A0AB39HT92_9BACI
MRSTRQTSTPRPVATSALGRPVRRGSPAAHGKRSIFPKRLFAQFMFGII